MDKKVKLKVLGLSYSQTQTGAYALVLEAENSEHRIPIIIGSFEAQSIAIQLENLKPPRPLTHDLFVKVAENLDAKLLEINIYKLVEGVFHSRLTMKSGEKEFIVDARTSDAVALALRFDAPIYTSQEIIDKAGLIINLEDEKEKAEEDNQSPEESKYQPGKENTQENLSEKAEEELNNMLQKAVENEAYEEAARIRNEIERRKSN